MADSLSMRGHAVSFFSSWVWLSKKKLGTVTYMCESYLPVLLSKIGLAISVSLLPVSDAVHCNRSRKRLRETVRCNVFCPDDTVVPKSRERIRYKNN